MWADKLHVALAFFVCLQPCGQTARINVPGAPLQNSSSASDAQSFVEASESEWRHSRRVGPSKAFALLLIALDAASFASAFVDPSFLRHMVPSRSSASSRRSGQSTHMNRGRRVFQITADATSDNNDGDNHDDNDPAPRSNDDDKVTENARQPKSKTIDVATLRVMLQDLWVDDPELKEWAYAEKLEITSEKFGVNHVNTLKAMNDYALTLYENGKFVEAEPLMNSALYLTRSFLGPKDMQTMRAFALYASSLPLKKQKLELSRKLLGAQHPDTLKLLEIVYDTLRELDRESEIYSLQVEWKTYK